MFLQIRVAPNIKAGSCGPRRQSIWGIPRRAEAERDPVLDRSDRHRLSLGQIVAFKGHNADDDACCRRVAKPVIGAPSPCCSFCNNPESPTETSQSKLGLREEPGQWNLNFWISALMDQNTPKRN